MSGRHAPAARPMLRRVHAFAGCLLQRCVCLDNMPVSAMRLPLRDACLGDMPHAPFSSHACASVACPLSRTCRVRAFALAMRPPGQSARPKEQPLPPEVLPPSSIAPPWGVVSMHSILHSPQFVKQAARKTNRFVRRQDAVFAAGVWTNTDNPPRPLYRENPSAAQCPRQAFGRYFLGHVPGRGRQSRFLPAPRFLCRSAFPASISL